MTFWHSCMYEAIALAKGLGFSCYNSRTLFLVPFAFFCRERDVPVAQDENARGHKTFWHSCMYEAIALAKGLGFSCYNSRTLFLASLAFCRERDVPVAQDENVRGYNDILAQLHV